MWLQVIAANATEIFIGFSMWFFARHTHGKWVWQWHKFGRFDKLGL